MCGGNEWAADAYRLALRYDRVPEQPGALLEGLSLTLAVSGGSRAVAQQSRCRAPHGIGLAQLSSEAAAAAAAAFHCTTGHVARADGASSSSTRQARSISHTSHAGPTAGHRQATLLVDNGIRLGRKDKALRESLE
ncbi:hypothetical protein MRX96_002922 [Rhipicephalus microplus]